jgi:hypothetical protein
MYIVSFGAIECGTLNKKPRISVAIGATLYGIKSIMLLFYIA